MIHHLPSLLRRHDILFHQPGHLLQLSLGLADLIELNVVFGCRLHLSAGSGLIWRGGIEGDILYGLSALHREPKRCTFTPIPRRRTSSRREGGEVKWHGPCGADDDAGEAELVFALEKEDPKDLAAAEG
jgi:hypothetical protein